MAPAFICTPVTGISQLKSNRTVTRTHVRHQAVRTWRAMAVDTPATQGQTAEQIPDTWVSAKDLSAGKGPWETVLDVEQIMDILPHRYPFLLIDRVLAVEPGKRAITVKNVTANEPQFTGHFPQRPIMPGVYQIEALAQTGGIVLMKELQSSTNKDFFFGGVDRVKWRRVVVPGDTLVMEMTMESFKPRFGIAKMIGKGFVDGQLAVEGSFTLAMVEKESK